nr:RNA polymerase sigma factor sigC-like isoform X2 [Coffea arabica]
MGFRLTPKWGFSIQLSFSTKTSSWPSSNSLKGWEAVYESAKMSSFSVAYGDTTTWLSDPMRVKMCSSATQARENDNSETEDMEDAVSRWSYHGSCNMAHNDISSSRENNNSIYLASLRNTKALHFGLLMKNLDVLEETIADSGVLRLEEDILVQLERLGALELFQTCLCRMLKPSTLYDLSDKATKPVEASQINCPVEDVVGKKVVHSVKKEKRKSRRKRPLDKGNGKFMQEKYSSTLEDAQQVEFSPGRKSSDSRSRSLKIARTEAEMSQGVKLVSELERIRTIVEENTGQVVGMSNWAEAAQVNIQVLQQHLQFGWYCRDELLRSTRSLVLYIARNYRGLGVAFEDLVQAGNLGVLQGAQRFDHTRGYKFSTYVQYWIRKSISMVVAQHARGIRIPSSLSKAISQIQKARKALKSSHGKYPDVNEIAKFTGLSTAKIMSVSKCLRIVGSIDQKVGDSSSAKRLELISDTSMRSPGETVVRQHMLQGMYGLMKDLEPRERQVLVLRFGLRSHQRKSLEEIGRLYSVSKEWVRKIERRALTKLRKKDVFQDLSQYMYM